RLEPGLRRDAAPLHRRHHHRARDFQTALHRIVEARVRGAARSDNAMRILGIETSCDETSAAVVEETGDAATPWASRSDVLASHVQTLRDWGGGVPALAWRQHSRDICGVVDRALADGSTGWTDLGAVAVTQGPGLVGSLLIGVAFAKAAAAAARLPLV